MKKSIIFNKYQELLLYIDNLSKTINDYYPGHICCKKECSHCCLPDINLFPIEIAYIKNNITPKQISGITGSSQASCIFLNKGLCSIYSLRPILCRTQGLPLLYQSDDNNNEFELSICELNFNSFDFEKLNNDCLINMEEINKNLALLNLHYLKEIDKFTELVNQRISMNDIIFSKVN